MEHESQQKELEESENRYKSLFNDSFEAKLIYNRVENKIIEVNDAAVNLFKIPKEEFVKLSFQDIKPKRVVDGILTEDQIKDNLSQIDKGLNVHVETLSKKADGTIFPTDVTLSIFGGDKNLIIVSYRDMSEKKKVQNDLEVSEKRFRSLFDYSFDAIFLMNTHSAKFENCNEKALELFQYSKEEITQMSPYDIVSPNQKGNIKPEERINDNLDKLKKNQRLRFEFNFRKSNGKVFEAEVSLLPIVREKNKYCLTVIRDISEKKRQEIALQKREEFLRKVIDLNPNLIFGKDKEGKFTVANRATGEFLGVEPNDLIGKNWEQFYVNQNEIDSISKSDSKVLLNKITIDNSIESITCCNGIKRSFQTFKMPILNDQGEVEQMINVASDISEHVTMENKLRKNNKELKKVNTELDHFVYRASHDLRAPLASILGFTNLTKHEESIQEIKLYNDFIEKQIKKLDGFIKDIINYSRISRIEVAKDPIDFDGIISDIFDSLRFLEKSDCIRKEVMFKGKEPFYSDLQNITFILKNLLSNAIKYSDMSKSEPYIRVKVDIGEDWAKVIISDNGIGIASEYLKSIFKMFFRATENSDGSGLGLFIVKQSVDKLKGRISVKSIFGEGSEFEILIPNTVKHDGI